MDTTIDTVEHDVIERSRELPIVVGFWALWCGPCRMLGPVLESEAAKRAGLLELVNLDVEAEPLVAARSNLQLAPLACNVPADRPDAPAAASVRELLGRHAGYLATDRPRRGPRVPGIHLMFVAAAVARILGLPLPNETAIEAGV